MSRSPSSWGLYHALVDRREIAPVVGAGRFNARYRMARGLRTVDFAGMSDETNEGYALGLRVGLAYSALEALEVVVGSKSVSVVDPDLAYRYRLARAAKLRAWLMGGVDGKDLKRELSVLESDESADDVRPIARGMRHLVFHGVYTPSGSGAAKSATLRGFLADLSTSVLDSVDEHFTAWVESCREEGR